MKHETKVTFVTQCWERDWEILLKTRRLERLLSRFDFDFCERMLLINNVNDYKKVSRHAEVLMKKKIITRYHIIEDYAEKVLNFFQIEKEGFETYYYYLIADLTAIYLAHTPYLLHITGDVFLPKKINGSWILKALEIMEKNSAVKVANLNWKPTHDEARKESFKEDEDFFYSLGYFSDQLYLIKVNDFRKSIYNERNPASKRYPKNGYLFEGRVDSWLRNHNYLRITYKHDSYQHKNISRNKFYNKLLVKLGYYSYFD